MSVPIPTAALRPARAASAPPTTRLRAHVAWNAAADLAARGASLWVSFFCARHLRVDDFGRFTYALAIVQFLWIAGDAAANSGYATRELARVRAAGVTPLRGAADVLWRARLAAAAVLTVATLVGAAFAPMPAALRPVLAAGSAYFLAYATFPDWALRAMEDFRRLFAANAAAALGLVAVTLVALPRTQSPAVAALAWAASFAAAALVALPGLLKRGVLTAGPATGAPWRTHARRSLVFSLGALAGIGSVQTPLLLSGALARPHDAGLFAAAFRLLLAVLGVFAVLWWPLFPVLARRAPGSPAHRAVVADASTLVVALSLPPTIACACFAEPLLAWLFGPGYAGAAPALRVAAWVLPVYAACGLMEQVALAADGEGVRLRVYGASAVTILGVGLVAVPRQGASGAALAMVAGFAVAAVLWAVSQRGRLPYGAALRRAAPVAAANAALAAAWIGLARVLPLPLALATGGGVYAAAVLGLRLVPMLTDAERRS